MCAKLQCNDCNHTFAVDLDDDAEFEIYRCDECDRALRAERGALTPKTLEEACQCGGKFWKGRLPKCPNCRSAHVNMIK